MLTAEATAVPAIGPDTGRMHRRSRTDPEPPDGRHLVAAWPGRRCQAGAPDIDVGLLRPGGDPQDDGLVQVLAYGTQVEGPASSICEAQEGARGTH